MYSFRTSSPPSTTIPVMPRRRAAQRAMLERLTVSIQACRGCHFMNTAVPERPTPLLDRLAAAALQHGVDAIEPAA